MKLTVGNIYAFPMLNKLTLIAGEGGLGKEVVHCGILDYECDKSMSNKYYDYNYDMIGGFLTLTSFLYAKDDVNLIYDAVKKLVAKDGSGLIIKNVFKLPISDLVIKYANNMDFPIFILNDSHPFFEDIIVEIQKGIDRRKNFFYQECQTELLLEAEGTGRKINRIVNEISPSIQSDILSIYFKPKSMDLLPEIYFDIQNALIERGLLENSNCMYYYHEGFLLLISSFAFHEDNPEELAAPYINAVNAAVGKNDVNSFDNPAFNVGISDIHHIRSQLGMAITESIYSGYFDKSYAYLDTYKAILPFARNYEMVSYSKNCISMLREHDTERDSMILNTLCEFIHQDGDIDMVAKVLDQHPNTIRYRLKKVNEVLGINPLSFGGYERLALAVRINDCLDIKM